MSAETKAALEAALAAHIADECDGRMLADYLMIVHSQDVLTDLSHFRLVLSETQPFHVSDGLASVGRKLLADIWDSESEV